ncbi:hypothetical protein AC249_AIPGENE4688 [Exaiptasia diaphana]|nr:hypothetical protein AC249_AIPGENE4688 [Exaiptasia diaphana]
MDSDYKELLVKIAREIKREDLETMRFLCDDFLPEANSIPQTASQSDVYIEALHFFRELKNAQKVSHENLEYLKRLLEKAKRDDLASKVEDFVSDSRSTSPEAVRPEPKIEPSEVLHSGSWTDDRTKAQTRKREKRKRYKERRREREGKLDGTGDVKEEQVHEDQTAEHNNQSQRTENQTKLSDENENQKFDEWPSLHQTTLSNFSGNKSNKRESRHHPKSLTDQQKSLTGQNGISKDGLPTTNTIKETVLNGITRPVVHKDPKDDVPRPAVYKDPKNDVPILKNDVPRAAVYKDPKNDVPILKNDVPRAAVYKDPKNDVPILKNDVPRAAVYKDPPPPKKGKTRGRKKWKQDPLSP